MSAELLGVPAEVEHDGKVYRLGPATQKAKGILEELLAGIAIRNVTRLKSVLGADYQSAYDSILKQVASGEYTTGKPGWLAALNSEAGAVAFTLSLFRVNHPGMTADECTAIAEAMPDEVNAAVTRIAPGFFTMAFPKMTPEQLATITAAFGNASPTTTQSANSMPL
jgi:hypothetical protein